MQNYFGTSIKFKWIMFLFLSFFITKVCYILIPPPNNISANDYLNTIPSKKELSKKLKETKLYKIGDKVISRDAKITINSIKKDDEFLSDKPKKNNEYIILNITIENIGNSIVSYNPFDFYLKGKDGLFKSCHKLKLGGIKPVSNGKLLPGKSITGELVFEEEKDTEGLILKFTSNIFSDDTSFIKLN